MVSFSEAYHSYESQNLKFAITSFFLDPDFHQDDAVYKKHDREMLFTSQPLFILNYCFMMPHKYC